MASAAIESLSARSADHKETRAARTLPRSRQAETAIASRAAAALARALAMSAGRTPNERIRKLMMGPTFHGDGLVVVVL